MRTEVWPKEQHPLGQVKGPPALPSHPPPLHQEAMERPNPEDDQSPQSPDGQAYDGPQSHCEGAPPQGSGPHPNHSMNIYPWMKKRKKREDYQQTRGEPRSCH